MAYSGRYTPKHPEKYRGNVRDIIYRSSWELKAFIFCDTNPRVVEWSSEEVVVPYRSPLDKEYHRYYVDLYAAVKKSDGTIQKYLFEIKPLKETVEPKPQQRKTKRYLNEVQKWLVNSAKWTAARAYAKKKGLIFSILTEKELKINR